jgi:hypothetical protein
MAINLSQQCIYTENRQVPRSSGGFAIVFIIFTFSPCTTIHDEANNRTGIGVWGSWFGRMSPLRFACEILLLMGKRFKFEGQIS